MLVMNEDGSNRAEGASRGGTGCGYDCSETTRQARLSLYPMYTVSVKGLYSRDTGSCHAEPAAELLR